MYQSTTIIGNLGQNPELRTLESGQKVCSFSVATSETWKDKQGEKQTETEWHSIVLWGNLADIANSYLKKGSKVLVIGRHKSRNWEDSEGRKHYAKDLIGRELKMLDSKPSGNGVPQQQSAPIGEGVEPNELLF